MEWGLCGGAEAQQGEAWCSAQQSRHWETVLQPRAAATMHHCAAREANRVFPTGSLLSSEPSFLFQMTASIGNQKKWNRL